MFTFYFTFQIVVFSLNFKSLDAMVHLIRTQCTNRLKQQQQPHFQTCRQVTTINFGLGLPVAEREWETETKITVKSSESASAMGNGIAWKVYDGKEPLESFLERNKPSQINNTDAPWISVRCENDDQEQEDESNYGSASMRTEWDGLIKNKRVKKVTAETLKDLAVKYNYTSGKWMIFGSRFVEISGSKKGN
jgi:hypothetical protein